ncbi:hypothetical protein [Kiloniella litopenaei]|uniref:helix-turn-helix domain-containing protein n=1 Tax=Kiloniella litopenaei TaxID=1549748 RepID=UPI003BA8934F
MADYPIKECMIEVVEFCGIELAEALCRAFPGITIYVPEKLHDRHEIVRLLGYDYAQVLHTHFAQHDLRVPVDLYERAGHRKDMVLSMAGRGKRIADICRLAKISEGRVAQILREAKEEGWDSSDKRQIKLL